jgi:hypothetical protein
MKQDPQQAWGVYAHCMVLCREMDRYRETNLYRETNPQDGFRIIERWAKQVVGNYFVFTSKVDGHFER